jgi:hypothetical protein
VEIESRSVFEKAKDVFSEWYIESLGSILEGCRGFSEASRGSSRKSLCSSDRIVASARSNSPHTIPKL